MQPPTETLVVSLGGFSYAVAAPWLQPSGFSNSPRPGPLNIFPPKNSYFVGVGFLVKPSTRLFFQQYDQRFKNMGPDIFVTSEDHPFEALPVAKTSNFRIIPRLAFLEKI